MFGPGTPGYGAEVSGSGKQHLMQVEPARLVDLAASSDAVLTTMAREWADAQADLEAACTALGDATGLLNVASSYRDSLVDAGEVVAGLTEALGLGVAGLVDAAQDASRADDDVAAELERAGYHVAGEARVPPRTGRGGH